MKREVAMASKPTLNQRRVNLTRQAGSPSHRPSEALGTRPEPPSLKEGWILKDNGFSTIIDRQKCNNSGLT
jgi:hypothetical protein